MAVSAQDNNEKCYTWKMRWFYSKGAYLVLTWVLLATLTFFIIVGNLYSRLLLMSAGNLLTSALVNILPLCSIVITAPLSGWMADAKFGNLKVHKLGNFILFLSSLFMCLITLVIELISSDILILMFLSVICSLAFIGFGAFIATSTQLGLDQMPEASSDNLTSFLNWHYFVLIFSNGLAYVLYVVNAKYIEKKDRIVYYQLSSIIPVLCMSIVLISDFFFSSKYLVTEGKAPQSLKTMYKILKFAAKHKSPLNRSALTYWEEDIPSRLDLGKSRYGGPFTTEQVEDVKSVLRLVCLGLTSYFGYGVFTLENVFSISKSHYNRSIFVSLGSYSGAWFCVGMVFQEFIVFPFFRSKFPGTLRRLEASYFLIVATCVVCLILVILNYCGLVPTLSFKVIFSVFGGFLGLVFIPAELEFACAQAPHYMRGMLISLVYLKYAISLFFAFLIFITIITLCTSDYCSIVTWSVLTGIVTVGFIFFVYVVSRYKLRIRDDGFAAQQLIEEIYDRNLTAAARFEQNF